MLALLYSLSQGQALKLSGAPLYRLKSAGATAAITVVVGGFVTRSLSLSLPVRAPMYASRPKWLPGVLPLQPNPPTTTIFFFFFFFSSSILGSSILHTVARLCLSLAPFNFSLPESFVTKPPSRPSKVAVLCLEKKRVSIHRPSDRNKRLFFFLASNFLDLGMKYKTQDRKKKRV
jgi:hypothetical protein